ncbi:hypothetical protein MBVG596_0221 [Mycoplasmopsis bovigenitalium]|uniref:cell division protein ZapB n=1 Tax=Mycoplasmopsis bovigenitalium TaxID=2112 RepID=UPI00090C1CDA|nr:cell division protein ZapB [Mycoplasmopsis bovigenitalium]BAW18097.1 hypothetical protein MBVG596_0221 [Mycoplasmopsis bovigenitalium]
MEIIYQFGNNIHSSSITSELEEKYSQSSRNIKKAIELSEKYITNTAQHIRSNAVSWTEIKKFLKNYHHYLFFLDQLKEIISIDNNKIVSKVDTYFAEKDLANRDELDGDYLDVLMWDGWNSLFSKSIKPLLEAKAAHDQVVAENTALKGENQSLKDGAAKLEAENAALKDENNQLKDDKENSNKDQYDFLKDIRAWNIANDYLLKFGILHNDTLSKLEKNYTESSVNIKYFIILLANHIRGKIGKIFNNPKEIDKYDIFSLINTFTFYKNIFLPQIEEIINLNNNELMLKADAYIEKLNLKDDSISDVDLQKALDGWNSFVVTLIKPLLDVKTAHDQVVAQNTTLKAENQNLKGEATKLKAENDALKTENQNIKDESAKLKAENDALKTENNQSKNDKENLQNQFDELTKKHNKLLANSKKDKNKIFIFIVLLLSINIILWVIIALIIFKKSYKNKSSI